MNLFLAGKVYLRGQLAAKAASPPLSEANTITVLLSIPARIKDLVIFATESSSAECIPVQMKSKIPH